MGTEKRELTLNWIVQQTLRRWRESHFDANERSNDIFYVPTNVALWKFNRRDTSKLMRDVFFSWLKHQAGNRIKGFAQLKESTADLTRRPSSN